MKLPDFDTFLAQEMDYFGPMLRREIAATPTIRSQWRKENVHERRRRVSLEVHQKLRGTVRYGPFSGLLLSRDSTWGQSDLGAMVLGLYEREILNWIKSNLVTGAQNHKIFIDIGAADGYYAVGMLVSGLADRSICFEINDASREQIRQNAKLNGVDERLEIHGDARTHLLKVLRTLRKPPMLVLVDIEGSEYELLTPQILDQLKGASLLIEIHHWVKDFESKYKNLLREAFANFRVAKLPPAERPLHLFRELDDLTDDNRQLLGSEGRPSRMRFLALD